MANAMRGEVAITIDGQPQIARLTLGALADLEDALGSESLLAVVERFEGGRFTSRDVLAVLLAGLKGGGWPGSADALGAAQIGGGPMAAARAAAELLARAFRLEP